MSATAERMTTAEVLRKALELLGPNGEKRCLYTHYGENDSCCMQGALLKASQSCDIHGRDFNSAWLFLAKAIYPSFLDIQRDGNPVVKFNDTPGCTFPEVKAAFEKAIELAEGDPQR